MNPGSRDHNPSEQLAPDSRLVNSVKLFGARHSYIVICIYMIKIY